jgi:SAM-dependent methyltransferase
LDESKLKCVLDIGTGTGVWALQFAEMYPECMVVGTDLSLIQPPPRTSNCQFILENSETEEWLLKDLDYVHLRSMGPCFSDFPAVIKKAYDHLAPGGWIEIVDGYWQLFSDDATTTGTALERFFLLLGQGGAALGRDMLKAPRYRDYVAEAGFTEVRERVERVPASPWPRDTRMKRLGQYAAQCLKESVDNYGKFLGAAGLTASEIEGLGAEAKRDLRRRDIHPWLPAFAVWARKPIHSAAAMSSSP